MRSTSGPDLLSLSCDTTASLQMLVDMQHESLITPSAMATVQWGASLLAIHDLRFQVFTLTEGNPTHPKRKPMVFQSVAQVTAARSTKGIVATRHFSATLTEGFPSFFLICNANARIWPKSRGAAHIPPQVQRLYQSVCPLHPSRPFGRNYATLGSNPRKPPNQSLPPHLLKLLSYKLRMLVVVLDRPRRKPVSVS